MNNHPKEEQDRVLASVAAYSRHLADYTATNADAVAAHVTRFCAELDVDDVILDAGCGPGRDLVRFAELGYCCVGVDLNPDFVAAARAAAEGWPVRVHSADLRQLPFEEDSFAAAWACASLVHLPPADALTALGELARVTRPEGRVCVSVKAGAPSGTGWQDTRHGRRWFQMWTPEALTEAATAAGLVVGECAPEGAFIQMWARVR